LRGKTQDLKSLPSADKTNIIIKISVEINPFGIINRDNDSDFAMISDFLPGIDFASISEVVVFNNDSFISQNDMKRVIVKKRNNTLREKASMNLNSNYTGGIDLTPANIPMETENIGNEIKFHMNSVMLTQLQNSAGFVPVLVNIRPLRNLKAFLES